MRFYTTLQLGDKRSLTPEGFTIFKDVSVARTGEQVYGPTETMIEPGPDGLVHIDRKPDEVFRPETIASCNGKPLTIDHPDQDVTPANWKFLAHGVMLDARRGSGEQKDELVVDLIVYTHEALAEIDSGKREVSLGYDADYFQTGEGRAEQRNILINHKALVGAGRCGARCAIKDHKHRTGDCPMKKSFKDRLLEAFNAKDEKAIKLIAEEIPEEPVSGATHIHVHTADKAKDEEEDPNEKRFKKIEDALEKLTKDKAKDESEEEKAEREKKEKEAKDKARDAEAEEKKKAEDAESEEMSEEVEDEDKEEAKKSKDSAFLSEPFEKVKMLAEIIAPGVRLPTFDKAADPKKTFRDCLCGLRRKALQLGTNDALTAGFIEEVRGKVTDGAEFAKMPCKDVRTIFNSVGAMKKAHNNGQSTRDTSRPPTPPASPMAQFIANSNKRHGIGK